MGCEEAERLEAHSLQVGAVRRVPVLGGTSAQLLKAGHWRSSVYRLSLDLGAEAAGAMERLLVEVSKDEAKPWGAEEGERIPLSKPWAFGSPKTRNRSGMFSDAGALFYSLFVKEPGPAGR